jgi:hypothetical protein
MKYFFLKYIDLMYDVFFKLEQTSKSLTLDKPNASIILKQEQYIS